MSVRATPENQGWRMTAIAATRQFARVKLTASKDPIGLPQYGCLSSIWLSLLPSFRNISPGYFRDCHGTLQIDAQ
jgi:hypothetical protein